MEEKVLVLERVWGRKLNQATFPLKAKEHLSMKKTGLR